MCTFHPYGPSDIPSANPSIKVTPRDIPSGNPSISGSRIAFESANKSISCIATNIQSAQLFVSDITSDISIEILTTCLIKYLKFHLFVQDHQICL